MPATEAIEARWRRSALAPPPVAVVDLDLNARNSERVEVYGFPPVWRALANRLGADGIRLRLFDPGLSGVEETVEELRQGRFGIVVLHLDNFLPGFVAPFLDRTKEQIPKVLTLACGYLPTVKPSEVLDRIPSLDGLLRGPLEAALPALAEIAVDEGIPPHLPSFLGRNDTSTGPCVPTRLSLQGLGPQCRQAPGEALEIGLSAGVGNIQASTGCVYRCAFCRTSTFYRAHSLNPYSLRRCDDVVEEIEDLSRRFGVRHFKFCDNNFLGTPKLAARRARELAEGLRERGLSITFELHCRSESLTEEVLDLLCPVGLRHLAIGVESMSPSQLARLEKEETVEDHWHAGRQLAKRGLMAQCYTILADPLASREELAQSLSGLRGLGSLLLVLIHERMTLYEETPYYRRHRKRIRRTRNPPAALGTVVGYHFEDPWLHDHFELLEQASTAFKGTLADDCRKYLGAAGARSLHTFVKEGTLLRLELLSRIVETDRPRPDRIEAWRREMEERIPGLAPPRLEESRAGEERAR